MKGGNEMRTVFTAYVSQPWTIENGYLKSPVTIAVEGVHFGSMGPIYWAAHILEQSIPLWEGVPVVINHPMVNGQYVSVIETPNESIGIVTRPYYDPVKKALKAEIEIPANHPKAGEIQQTREVSMGIFSTERYEAGQWNGESYHACALRMEPDHLAILPNEKGACSWEKGCGIRNNAALQALRGAAMTFVTNLTGGSTMKESPLMPPGTGTKEKIDYNKIQKEAADRDILLPTGMNRRSQSEKQTWNGQGEKPLLPTGL